MTKRIMNENSLKNLKKDFTRAERQENGRKGAEVTNKLKAEKVKRLEANEYLWDKYFTPQALDDMWSQFSPKEKLDLLKTILPKDKQDINLTGGLEVQKVFITEQEHKETIQHIQDVINEQ